MPSFVICSFNKVSTDPLSQQETVYGVAGSSSGGALEYILASAAKELFQLNDVPTDPQQQQQTGRVVIKIGKNADVKEYMLQSDDGRILLRFASAYGFRNIQNIVRKIKTGKCNYHYVEVMACPGGCANGGGQLPAQEQANLEQVIPVKDWVQHVEQIYRSAPSVAPEANESLKAIYK